MAHTCCLDWGLPEKPTGKSSGLGIEHHHIAPFGRDDLLEPVQHALIGQREPGAT
jgi:hypothetical protein